MDMERGDHVQTQKQVPYRSVSTMLTNTWSPEHAWKRCFCGWSLSPYVHLMSTWRHSHHEWAQVFPIFTVLLLSCVIVNASGRWNGGDEASKLEQLQQLRWRRRMIKSPQPLSPRSVSTLPMVHSTLQTMLSQYLVPPLNVSPALPKSVKYISLEVRNLCSMCIVTFPDLHSRLWALQYKGQVMCYNAVADLEI